MRDDPAVAHSARFGKMCAAYALIVTEAYGGDMAEAMADGDELVAARVAEWERSEGLESRDWIAIGRDERDPVT